MLTVNVTDDLEKMTKGLTALSDRDLKFATALALTRSAFDAMNAIKEEMFRVFDRPNPYTINSLKVDKATKEFLWARVSFRENAGKGTPASKYLSPEVFGGGRTQRGSERELTTKIGGQKVYLTPGPGAPVDQYGNVPAAKYSQILAFLKAGGQVGLVDKKGSKGKPKARFFIVKPGERGPLPPGIYERTGDLSLKAKGGSGWGRSKGKTQGRGFRMIFHLTVKQPTYQANRFDFFGMGQKLANAAFPKRLKEALLELQLKASGIK